MYLSKLSIHGFKSFADPTELRFDEGLTAIVGPNGCGKSNIVDAVRWVIGEQRARVLRSEKMENVIFNGTAGRRPLGMAEVQLTVENNRGVLPTEYNEVTLGRRLYRSGDSEYLLNGVQCRLKDITELFMDTGMGADAYSVIELKMVDEILSDSTEDRRRLFEEAAGITKYKQRRRQALRKLENTQADLTRVRDLTDEVGKRVRTLKRQANKAARYNEQKERLEELELLIAQAEFDRLHRQREAKQEALQAANDEVDAYTARQQQQEAKLESLRTDAIEREQRVSARQQKLAEHKEAVRSLEADLRLVKERLSSASAERERLVESQTDLDQRRSLLREKRETLDDKIRDQQPVVARAQDGLEELRATRDSKQAEAQEARKALDKRALEEKRVRETRIEKQRELDRLENRIELLNEERARVRESAESTTASTADLSQQVDEAKDNEAQAAAKVEQLRAEVTALREEQEELEQELKLEREQLRKAERSRDAAANEVALLESLVSSYEEFSDAVQFLAEEDSWGEDGLQTVADLLHCPPEHRLALDAALGGYAACIVVPSADHIHSALQLLDREERGRASFLALDRLKTLATSGSPPPENLTSMREIVTVDDEAVTALADVLLGDCYLASSLAESEDAVSELPASARVITPRGEWVDGRGVVHGGSTSHEPAAASRRLERREQLAETRSTLEAAEDDLAEASRAVQKLEKRLDQLPLSDRKQALDEAESAWRNTQRTLEQAEFAQQRAEEQESERASKLADIKQTLDRLAESRKHLSQSVESALQQEEVLSEKREKAEITFSELDAAERQAQEAFNQANIEAVKEANRLENLERERERTNEALAELAQRREQQQVRIEELTANLKRAEEKKSQLADQLAELRSKRGALDDAVTEARTHLMEIKVQIDEVEKQLRQLRSKRESLLQSANEHQVRLAEINTRLEDLTNKLTEEYDRSLTDDPVELPADFEAEPAREEMHKLRRSIQRMGSINALALEEYEEEQERLDFLTEQQADLEEAEDTLLETITEINTTAAKRFSETYEAIRTNFQELFQELFGTAASADLELEDPEDPLETPIEIRAKPRGKRPVILSQLSSGEKALTAAALLFSIYLVKPSPFCILDEVDAPLDDANVQRFMRLIQRFSDRTQFILVTHNQQTMEHADRLYGITMQEHGVSKLVSVKFDEALEMAG